MNWSLQNTSSWFLKQRMFFASNDTTFQPMNACNVSLNVLVDKYLVLCTSNGCGCPKGNCFFCNKNFVSSIMGITEHLRCQVNLFPEKQYKCPWFVNTCWLSMEQFLSLLILNRPHLTQHFDEKRPSCSPTKSFWILAYVSKGFVLTVNSTLVAIQGLSPLLNKQEKCLELLVNTLKEDCIVNGSDQFTDVLEHVLCGSYQVS